MEPSASTTATETGNVLEVRRTIRAPRERVFDAWTQSKEVMQWHAPGPLTVPEASIDLRVGGEYHIHMMAPDGKDHHVYGTYREIDRPKRLVYTWSWKTDAEPLNSVVTIEFIDLGTSTEVVLQHVFARREQFGMHEQGWVGCLAKLEAMFA